jgi:hypothetical protein
VRRSSWNSFDGSNFFDFFARATAQIPPSAITVAPLM